MSYRRAKNVSYDDDDDGYDDYDSYEQQAEETSPEDKQQLQQGAIKVKSALGSGFQIPDEEIREALWHYYFDVDKSVAYLKGKHKPKSAKPPKPKPESKFDLAAKSATNHTNDLCHESLKIAKTSLPSNFFWDMPWGKVPYDRIGNFTFVPLHPVAGLLGGAPKISKLAALAAARKKQSEEKRPTETTQGSTTSNKTVALLDQLVSKHAKSGIRDPSQEFKVEPAMSNSRAALALRKKPTPEVEAKSSTPEVAPIEESVSKPKLDMKARPSAFAQALFGAPAGLLQGGALLTEPELSLQERGSVVISQFELPYATSQVYQKIDPFAKPSPDDVVLNAQSKGPVLGQAAKQPTRSSTSTVENSVEDIASLSIRDMKVPSKNLDVSKEFEKSKMKKSATFVVVGHVDHGKSTLMGRLLYDLKFVNEQTMRKFQKEADQMGKGSFALAWVLDSTSDERERGITVDTATKTFETSKTRFTILDAPGHQDFIPNMIAGASQADFAVLVVDSGVNSFESGLKGQTKEHALLARSMGLQRLIVIVNKMDRVDWSQERFTEIRESMMAFLTSANFSPASVSFIPCAGLTGENIAQRPMNPRAEWYKGPTLVEELDGTDSSKRIIDRPLRMTIEELYSSPSRGTASVHGRIDSGSLQTGDTLIVQPASETAMIKSIVADETPADWAVAGQMVLMELVNIDPAHIHRGDIVCTPKDPVQNIAKFTAKILTFEHVMPMFVDVHRGRINMPGKIASLVATLDKSTGKVVKKKPRVVQPATVVRVGIELEREMPVESGWRIVLRADGHSVAAGLVE